MRTDIETHATHQDERDERLVELTAQGDEAAFRALFGRWVGPLHAYFMHMTGQRALAQDLTQETFLRVWRASGRFDGRRSFRAWVFRIASNVCTDHSRSWFAALARRTMALFEPRESGLPAPADTLSGAAGDRPERRAERVRLHERLAVELARLPAPHREAVVLHDLQGLTVQEAAVAMGRPRGSVLSWVQRGRAGLRRALEAEGGKEAWL